MRVARVVLAALAVGGFVAQASAAPELKVSIYAGYGTNGGSDYATVGPITRSSTGNGTMGSATSRGISDFGVLKSYTQATSIAGSSNFNNLVMATSELHFADDLTIDAAGLTGTSGTLKVKFTIDGALSATQPQVDPIYSQTEASASYTLSKLGYGPVLSASHSVYADGSTYSDGNGAFLGVEQLANVPFTFGTPFTLRLTVGSGAAAYTQFGGQAIADLEHTVTWGGFDSVLNGSGGTVTEYSFNSSSGTNYVNAIPEPAAAGLLLVGATCVAMRRRRG